MSEVKEETKPDVREEKWIDLHAMEKVVLWCKRHRVLQLKVEGMELTLSPDAFDTGTMPVMKEPEPEPPHGEAEDYMAIYGVNPLAKE